MRFLAIATIAILVCVCIIVIVLALTQYRKWWRRHLERHAQWVTAIVDSSDTTYVSVKRVAETLVGRIVLDEQHVGFVGHNNPAWTTHMMELREKAWDRAAVLNGLPEDWNEKF